MFAFVFFLGLFGLSLKVVPGIILTWDYLIVFRYLLQRIRIRRDFLIFSGLTVSFLIAVGLACFSSIDLQEFFNSLVNYLLFLIAFAATTKIDFGRIEFALSVLSKTIFWFAVIQIISNLYFGSEIFYFILDPVSISTAEDIGRFEAVNLLGYMRPLAQYHEPSYLALVCNVILALRLNFTKKWDIYCVLSIILSLSMVGYFTLMLTIFLSLSKFRRALFLSLAAFTFLYFNDFFRFSEILVVGTSGYERIGVIIDTISQLLTNNLIPIPLGNWPRMPNNSMQVLLGYFSFFSPIVVLYLIRHTPVVILGALFGLFMTNGAVFTFSGGFLLGMLSCRKSN